MIQLENVPTHPPTKIGIPKNVEARIAFAWLRGGDFLIPPPINHVCWIDHPTSQIDFPLNKPRYLVIGVVRHTTAANAGKIEAFQLFGVAQDVIPYAFCPTAFSGAFAFKVSVDVIVDEFGEWTHHFEFELKRATNGMIMLDRIG